jgi:hypothetical protein
MTTCIKCGKEFEGEIPGTRRTTVNIRNGRSVLSTTVSEICPECTRTKQVGIVIEKINPADDGDVIRER